MSDLIERLRAEALTLHGQSIIRGYQEAGIASSLAEEAADRISDLEAEVAKLTVERDQYADIASRFSRERHPDGMEELARDRDRHFDRAEAAEARAASEYARGFADCREQAARAIEDQDRSGYEWVRGSLWDTLYRRYAPAIRSLTPECGAAVEHDELAALRHACRRRGYADICSAALAEIGQTLDGRRPEEIAQYHAYQRRRL